MALADVNCGIFGSTLILPARALIPGRSLVAIGSCVGTSGSAG